MLGLRTTSTRRKRAMAVFAVLLATTIVPPAFGADPLATKVAQALKLAKRADKNATTAIKLAKSAGTSGTTAGDAGERGPQGVKGDTGATGATGATGPAGAAGAKGDKGDTGAKGDKGDTGVAGHDGVAQALTGSLAAMNLAAAYGVDPLLTVTGAANTKYVVTVHVELANMGGSVGGTADCELRANGTAIDATHIYPLHGNYSQSSTLTGLAIPPASGTYVIGLYCIGDQSSITAGAKLTAVSVA